MKKVIYVLFMAFLFISCGESHHQVTGSVDYCFEGDSVTHTIPFQKDYYLVSVSEDSSELDLYIVRGTGYAWPGYFGPYNLVNAPGKKITYSNLNYKYTVKIN